MTNQIRYKTYKNPHSLAVILFLEGPLQKLPVDMKKHKSILTNFFCHYVSMICHRIVRFNQYYLIRDMTITKKEKKTLHELIKKTHIISLRTVGPLLSELKRKHKKAPKCHSTMHAN